MRLGFIGTGNMNSAILEGVVKSGFDPQNITITNRTMAKALKFKDLKVNIEETSQAVIDNSDVLILGMKPYGYQEWLEEYNVEGKTIISIGAGITSSFLRKYTQNYVITMPNTPSKVGFGSTLVVENDNVTEEIINIFNSIGTTHLINEDELSVYTLVTGSSPAYIFNFIANLSDSLTTKYSLEQEEVNTMLIQVLNGAARMLADEPNPHQLCDNVCSPGGITIEVVNELNKGLPAVLDAGLDNAMRRTKEMQK